MPSTGLQPAIPEGDGYEGTWEIVLLSALSSELGPSLQTIQVVRGSVDFALARIGTCIPFRF